MHGGPQVQEIAPGTAGGHATTYTGREKEDRLWRISTYFGIFGLVLMIILGENASITSSDKNRKMHNRMMAWMLTALSVIMMWGFWACVYMAQMYPLFLPEIEVAAEH